MFNYDTFSSDMSHKSVPGTAAHFVASSSKHATLYVFSPSIIPGQVLRSYVYDFSPNLPDQLLASQQRNVNRVSGLGISKYSPEVNSSILPSINGVALDTTALSTQWTFVLQIDTTPPHGNRIAVASPRTRIIATGFCTEEPINPMTNTINPRAVLMFTKSSTSQVANKLTQNGVSVTVSNSSDLDNVSELNNMITYNNDLYMGTPRDIRTAISHADGAERVGAYGTLCLGNMKLDEGARMIPGQLKTPKVQLNDILQSVESAVDYTTAVTDSIISDTFASTKFDDPLTTAKTVFDESVLGSQHSLPMNSIDTSKPMSLDQLGFIFGSDLEVVPFRVPLTNSWETTSQHDMSKRNQMSAMISASLSNLVPACGLANITFRYMSYTFNGPMIMDENTGCWEIMGYGTLVECNEITLNNAINSFKHYFEVELVPIIKLVNGAFNVLVHIDSTGYILVDLVYRDEYELKPNEGFYETSSRIGGYVNPLVGTLDTINNNATQLDQLVTDLLCTQLGSERFFKPIIGSDTAPLAAAPMNNTQPDYSGIFN